MRQIHATGGYVPGLDVLANVKRVEGWYPESTVPIVVSDLAVSPRASEGTPAPESESSAGRGATCEGEGDLPFCLAVSVSWDRSEGRECEKDEWYDCCELDC